MRRETHDELAHRMTEAGRVLPTLSLVRHVRNGDLYRVHDIALDKTTLDPVVIYAPNDRPDIRFVRPLSAMLASFVRVEGL